VEIPLEILRI